MTSLVFFCTDLFTGNLLSLEKILSGWLECFYTEKITEKFFRLVPMGVHRDDIAPDVNKAEKHIKVSQYTIRCPGLKFF